MKMLVIVFETATQAQIEVATTLVRLDPRYVAAALKSLSDKVARDVPEGSRFISLQTKSGKP